MLDELKILIPVLAGLFTVVWACSKFFYQERKQKKERTSHLMVKCNMKKIGIKESFNVVKLNLNIVNKSATKMYVLADYINIYGISMAAKQLTEEEYLKMSAENIERKKYAFLHRFVELKDKILVYSGKIFNYDDYWWLEQGERLRVNRIVYIPKNFDYAEMIVTIYYSLDKDWLAVKTTPRQNEKGLCHEVILNTTKNKGEKFDWHNKEHLKLHHKYRNAEINNSSLLFIE